MQEVCQSHGKTTGITLNSLSRRKLDPELGCNSVTRYVSLIRQESAFFWCVMHKNQASVDWGNVIFANQE